MWGGLVACAQGGKFQGTAGQSGDAGSSGSAGSAGNAGSSGSAGSAGTGMAGTGTGGTGGSSTTGGTAGTTTSSTSMCSDSPCKLSAPQCGCAAGEMCTLDQVSSMKTCGPAGSVGVGQACDPVTDCAPGGFCAGVAPTQGYCVEFCDVDADCGNTLCLIGLNDANGNQVPGVTFCTNDCTPVSNAGCAADLTCVVGKEQAGQMRTFGLCRGHGAGAQGSTCANIFDCSLGSDCFTVTDANMNKTNQCLKYCDLGAPSCPANTTCADLGINYKNKNWGACL